MPLVTLRSLALLLALFVASPAVAGPAVGVEPRLASSGDDAKICGVLARAAEQALGIPDHLLRAVGVVESGRYDRRLGRAEPWPWTINAEGAGATFSSKAAAVARVEELRASGVRSIDIGCMQVNLAYHGDAFENLEEAFDPVMNVAYAAHFLTSLKEERGSWNAAVAAYHSSTPKFGIPYRQKVAKTWHGLRGAITQDKVRQRRSAIAEAYQKRKAEFEAHQARVVELQKAKREARRKGKAEAKNRSAVQELRGATTPRAAQSPDDEAAEPLQTAVNDRGETDERAVALPCEETANATGAAGKRRFDPALARQIMEISASAEPDDGFALDGKDAQNGPVVRSTSGAAVVPTSADDSVAGHAEIAEPTAAHPTDQARPGCPRLIEHRGKGQRSPATSPIVIRG